MQKIKAVKGRAKSFEIIVQDTNQKPKDLTGFSVIRLKINYDGGCLTKYAPKTAGVDEIQTITFPSIPDGGSFKIKIGDETTAAIAFGATAAAIAAAINALNEYSGAGVVGDISSGSSAVTFATDDGSREQPAMEIVENSLTIAAVAVTPTVTETLKGAMAHGIEVVEAKCGSLKIFLSKDDVDLLDVKNDQDLDLYVRIGVDDVDMEPIRQALDVEQVECGC